MAWLRIVLLGFTAVAILLEEFGLGLALITAAYIVLSWEYEQKSKELTISRSFVDYMTREVNDE